MKNKNLITTFSTKYNQNRNFCPFWATVCKTVRPMLSDRCPVCLSVCLSCLSCLSCLLCWCIVAKRVDGSRWKLAGIGAGHIV